MNEYGPKGRKPKENDQTFRVLVGSLTQRTQIYFYLATKTWNEKSVGGINNFFKFFGAMGENRVGGI